MVDASAAGLTTAFAAGAISFLSPCVLPLVPAYISYIVGQTVEPHGEGRLRTMLLSLFFVLGFTTVFVILGAGVNVLSSVLAPFRYQVTLLSGALVILFGVFTLGLWRPAWSERELRVQCRPQGQGPCPPICSGWRSRLAGHPALAPCSVRYSRLLRRLQAATCRSAAASRPGAAVDCRRRHDRHGRGDDDWSPDGVCVLVPRNVPCTRPDRLNGGVGASVNTIKTQHVGTAPAPWIPISRRRSDNAILVPI